MTASVSPYDRAYAVSHSVAADNWLFDELVALLSPQPGWRVLDVGCNTGELTARLAALQCQTLGIDINTAAIALARQRHPHPEFAAADIGQVAAPNFDAVVASHVIEHLPDVPEFLRAAGRRLNPGGCLVLATPNRHALFRRVAHQLWGVSFFDDPTHQRFFAPRELRELLARAGFVQVRTYTRRLYLPLAARLPERAHLAIPACGLGDHLLASARAPRAQT